MPAAKGSHMIFGNDIARFWSKTRADGDCIIWIAAKDKDGYGKFATGPSGNQSHHRPHRWIYAQAIGVLPPLLMHSCDNRACVKLQHLDPGTQKQNVADAIAKDRFTTGERCGTSKLTSAQVEEIREALASRETHQSIADRFGVTKHAISAISSGRNWKPR